MALESEILFSLARRGIETEWGGTRDIATLSDEYWENGASFVTLRIAGALRGCIGSLMAHQPLWKDLESNAHSAAFRDPRFLPLTEREYGTVSIEISLLTPPESVTFSSEEELRGKIVPGRDGIILTSRGRRATFLPQVWDELPEFSRFFSHLFQKAGLGPVPDFCDCSIERYGVTKYHE